MNNIRPTFKGKVIAGHHTYSASKYPQLANLGEIIYPATFREHLYGWHGGRYKLSLPGKPLKIVIEFYSKRQRILLIQSGELRVESGVIAIQILG